MHKVRHVTANQNNSHHVQDLSSRKNLLLYHHRCTSTRSCFFHRAVSGQAQHQAVSFHFVQFDKCSSFWVIHFKIRFPCVYNTLPSHPALSVCCFAYLCLFLIAASLRCDIHLQLHVLGEGKFNFCRNENTLMRVRRKFSLDLWERNQTQTLGWLNASAS